MSELADDLRATAEDLIEDAERLKEIEKKKSMLDPRDARLAKLSADAERTVRRMLPKAVAEKELVDGLAAEPS